MGAFAFQCSLICGLHSCAVKLASPALCLVPFSAEILLSESQLVIFSEHELFHNWFSNIAANTNHCKSVSKELIWY